MSVFKNVKYKGYEIVRDPGKLGPVLIFQGDRLVGSASGEVDAKHDIDNEDIRLNNSVPGDEGLINELLKKLAGGNVVGPNDPIYKKLKDLRIKSQKDSLDHKVSNSFESGAARGFQNLVSKMMRPKVCGHCGKAGHFYSECPERGKQPVKNAYSGDFKSGASIKAYASRYRVTISDKEIQDMLQALQSGELNSEDVADIIRDRR